VAFSVRGDFSLFGLGQARKRISAGDPFDLTRKQGGDDLGEDVHTCILYENT
jgi:hypothetical protein